MKKRGRRKIGTTETDSSVWIVVLIYAICIPKRNKHPVDPVRIEPEPTSIDSNQFTRRRSSTGRWSCTQGAATCRELCSRPAHDTHQRHTGCEAGVLPVSVFGCATAPRPRRLWFGTEGWNELVSLCRMVSSAGTSVGGYVVGEWPTV